MYLSLMEDLKLEVEGQEGLRERLLGELGTV